MIRIEVVENLAGVAIGHQNAPEDSFCVSVGKSGIHAGSKTRDVRAAPCVNGRTRGVTGNARLHGERKNPKDAANNQKKQNQDQMSSRSWVQQFGVIDESQGVDYKASKCGAKAIPGNVASIGPDSI